MHVARPMATTDVSYHDEDGTVGRGAPGGPGATNSGTNHNVRGGSHHLAAPATYSSSRKPHSSSTSAAAVVTDTYIRVEGQAYRVQKGVPPSRHVYGTSVSSDATNRGRRCSDVATQSTESSFAATITTNPSVSAAHFSLSSSAACDVVTTTNTSTYCPPPPPVISADPPPPPCVQVGVPSRGASPILLAPAAQMPHAILATPSPMLTYGYDPSYCQYLGQAADGYQYELVRRPSIGPSPADLQIPSNNHLLRRPSTGAPYPPVSPIPPHSPAPLLGSYGTNENSFDSLSYSVAPQSVTPVFIQASSPAVILPHPPLTPRHLHHPATSTTPPHRPPSSSSPAGGHGSGFNHHTSNSAFTDPNSSRRDNDGGGSGLPKLIHETSI